MQIPLYVMLRFNTGMLGKGALCGRRAALSCASDVPVLSDGLFREPLQDIMLTAT